MRAWCLQLMLMLTPTTLPNPRPDLKQAMWAKSNLECVAQTWEITRFLVFFFGGFALRPEGSKPARRKDIPNCWCQGLGLYSTPMMWPKPFKKKTTGQWKPSCPLRPANTAGAIIGKSGTTLKQIRERWDSQLPSSGTVWGRRKVTGPTRFEGWNFPCVQKRCWVEGKKSPGATWGLPSDIVFFPLRVGRINIISAEFLTFPPKICIW